MGSPRRDFADSPAWEEEGSLVRKARGVFLACGVGSLDERTSASWNDSPQDWVAAKGQISMIQQPCDLEVP